MRKQDYRQEYEHWNKQETHAARNKQKLKEEFIKHNAPYPIGSKVKAENNKTVGEFIIASYDMDKNLMLSPVFETLEGKKVFMSRPIIFELIK